MLNKNVQTLSVEGKDVLSKYFRTNDKTVYKGSLDDAMEVDKLKTINKNIIKYSKVKNRLYSDDILTVTFEYAYSDKDGVRSLYYDNKPDEFQDLYGASKYTIGEDGSLTRKQQQFPPSDGTTQPGSPLIISQKFELVK